MTIVEIGLQQFVRRIEYIAPGCFKYTINLSQLAEWWLDIMGAEDETTTERSFFLAVIVDSTERFNKVGDYHDLLTIEKTWMFLAGTQELCINYGPSFNPILDQTEYLKAVGFCDTKVVYVDDIAYLPVITSAPKITARQDLINYDRLAFSTGTIGFANEAGFADYLKSGNFFANDVSINHLHEDSRDEYTRDELSPLQYFLIEDISMGMKTGNVSLQDVRKTLNRNVPINVFTRDDYADIEDGLVNKPVPWIFGTVTAEAICTNGDTTSGSVTYRIAEQVTSFGAVQAEVDDEWVTVSPTSSSMFYGEFTLSEIDGRDGERPRRVRCVDCVGWDGSKPSVVISKMETLALGIQYTDSFYDTAEIAAEEATLAGVAIYLDEQVELFEVIRQLQEGSSNRFRYEINAEGLRTIRLDNLARESIAYVAKEQILENDALDIYTDKPTIAASIKIEYGNDFTAERKTVIDSSQSDAVAASVRERTEIEFSTFLQTEEQAVARAALEVSRLGKVRRFTDITLRGAEFLFLRIYDIITVELHGFRRDWEGVWKCQVLGISPNTQTLENKVKLLLVERVSTIDEGKVLKIGHDGSIKYEQTDIIKVG